MPSATKTAAARGRTAGDNLLKGSDLAAKTTKIKVVCTDMREAPEEFRSALIMEIEPVYNKTEWALNKTNIKALVTLISDDYEKWIGWEIELAKSMVNNPQTRSQAWGLMVIGATKLKRKVKPAVGQDVPF
jgi:hypothetical protein